MEVNVPSSAGERILLAIAKPHAMESHIKKYPVMPAARVTYHHICTLSSAKSEFKACEIGAPAGVCKIKTKANINATKNNNKAAKNNPRMILSTRASCFGLLMDNFVLT